MPTVVDRFISVTPTTENYPRGVVLFGRNVASYKFALAKSLPGPTRPEAGLLLG